MGWITRKFQRTGRAKWGKTISDEKRQAPLRKIVSVLRYREGMFDCDTVELECGHTGFAWGDKNARCTRCLKEAADAGSCSDPRTGDL
jgi:hypothetical protein